MYRRCFSPWQLSSPHRNGAHADVCVHWTLKRQSSSLLLLEVWESRSKFSLWVSANWFAGPSFWNIREALWGRNIYSSPSHCCQHARKHWPYPHFPRIFVITSRTSLGFRIVFFCLSLDWSGKLFRVTLGKPPGIRYWQEDWQRPGQPRR